MIIIHSFFDRYKKLIEETQLKNKDLIEEIDILIKEIRDHINGLDKRLHDNKKDFMLAIRLVECFRILEWIKVCFYCGSYHTVYRELRYIIDAMTQAFYIDTKLPSAKLKTKFEAFKMFDEDSKFDFIGTNLINKLDGIPNQDKLRNLYKELSDFIHPSYKQSLHFMDKASGRDPWDRMKENIYDEIILKDCIFKCKEVIHCFLEINKRFERFYLSRVGSDE